MLRFSLSKHIRCYVSTLTITAMSSNAALFCLTVSITIFAARCACKPTKPLNNRMLCMIVPSKLNILRLIFYKSGLIGRPCRGFAANKEIEAHLAGSLLKKAHPRPNVCVRAVRQNGDGMRGLPIEKKLSTSS